MADTQERTATEEIVEAFDPLLNQLGAEDLDRI